MLELTDVKITRNSSDFHLNLEHIEGGRVWLTVKARDACFDEKSRLLAFTGIWEDGEEHTYKLLPISKGFGKEHHTMVSEIAAFLASFGVTYVTGRLLAKTPNSQNSTMQGGSYFMANKLFAPTIRSFVYDLFDNHEKGFYNVANNKLIFKEANKEFYQS